jgi:hypothetical protein
METPPAIRRTWDGPAEARGTEEPKPPEEHEGPQEPPREDG